MGDKETTHVEETKDLTLGDLESLDAIVGLGQNAASLLKTFGTVTFYVDEQGKVRLANSLLVYLDASLAHPPDDVEPRFVRPIITAGKPQYVAKRPDGSLWEVEFPRPELDEPADGASDESILEESSQ